MDAPATKARRYFRLHLRAGRGSLKTMIARIPWLVAAMWLVLAASCSHEAEPNPTGVMKMQLTSTAFLDGQTIPQKYTGRGDDISPPLQWTGAPSRTKSFALICEDPDAPMGTWTHWLIYNLPAGAAGLPENVAKTGSLPDGSRQGENNFHNLGYNGPAPPPGRAHRYFFKLYALDTVLPLDAGADKGGLMAAMNGHVLARGQLMGTYQSQ